MFTKYQKPILDKFLADGTLLEWGFDTTGIHKPDGYTHSRWIAANSHANIEKAIMAIVSAYRGLPAAEKSKVDADHARMVKKHRDYFVESSYYHSKPIRLDKGYVMGSFFQAKPGKRAEIERLWEKHQRPIFDQLFAEGTILAYGIDSEMIHTEEPGGFVRWYVLPDLAAEDKVNAAFAAAREKMTQEERDAMSRSMQELTQPEKHRDFLTVILHYASRGYQPPTS
jgi:hypothetical protein